LVTQIIVTNSDNSDQLSHLLHRVPRLYGSILTEGPEALVTNSSLNSMIPSFGADNLALVSSGLDVTNESLSGRVKN